MSISVSNLVKVYGAQRAVDDISFEVKKGEVLGFLGPNGAGKSTTMKMLTCFLPQTSGRATVCGYDTSTHPLEVRRQIGYLPENNPLYHDMYVQEYLEFMAALHQLGSRTQSRIAEMIEATGLTTERHKVVGALSKGYKQRVGLAQAMLHNPEVLILDEPTSGLDPNQLTEIRELIRNLGRDKTVIFSSHIMQEVQAVADRVIIINKGKIVADDTTDTLSQKLQNEVRVIVEYKQSIDRSMLRGIKGVKRYEQTYDGKWAFVADGTVDIREQLFLFAGQHQLTILSLHQEVYSLEDVFKQLTVG
jgi:ABC-2 type transport system ATP-binding protein